MIAKLDAIVGSSLTAANATTTALGPAELTRANAVAFVIEWDATAAAGALVVETAPTPDYTGTWAALDTINFVAASSASYWSSDRPYRALRVRVSSAVTSGTVTIWAVVN